MGEQEFEFFTPAQAVEYLREQRGIILKVATLRSRRRYKTAEAKHTLVNNTLWTKAELDAIVPSKKTKMVNPDDEEASEGAVRGHKVTCNNSSLVERLPDLVA